MNVPKVGKEIARMSDSVADVLFGSGISVDDFYEDLKVMRQLADAIIDGLPRLSPHEGMAQASAGWTLVTVEPKEGYPDFTMPPIPGLFGVPYDAESSKN